MSNPDNSARTDFRWDSADVAKFIMSLAILVLHTNMFGDFTAELIPVLRMAVPVFFMISSYLFFRDLIHSEDKDGDRFVAKLMRYVVMVAKLYLFWLLVLIIPTAVFRDWLVMPLWEVPLSLIFRITFSSTFIGSWYLSASAVALSLLVFLLKRLSLSLRSVLLIGGGLYLFSLLGGTYCWLLPADVQRLIGIVSEHWMPYNSFPVALFWMSLGYMVAARESSFDCISSRFLAFVCAIGIMLTYLERALVCSFDPGQYSVDIFLMLPLSCVPAFVLLRRSAVQIDSAISKALRRRSTIIYCLHGTFSAGLREVVALYIPLLANGPINAVVTLLVCGFVSLLIPRLSERPGLAWFRNAW